MQSRQCYLPEVVPPLEFTEASALRGACLAHRDGPPPDLDCPVVLVGPEGGWSDRELAAEVPHVRLTRERAAVGNGGRSPPAVLLTGLRSALVGRHVG